MEKFIEVYDNYVPLIFQDYVENLILGKNIGSFFPLYVNISLSKGTNNDFGFENQYRVNDPHKGTINQVLYFLAINRKIIVQDIQIQRVFFQPKTTTPFIPKKHIDLDDHHWVCLYYVNDSDGDTIFYNDKGNEIKKVSPKKGRIAFFDGSIEHSAGMPTKNHRIVINIGFNGLFVINKN